MKDLLSEIFASINHNRMRIVLTGFSIGWGIFLLIVMLGSGNGVLHGVKNGFPVGGDNIIVVKPGELSKPTRWLRKGLSITLTDEDCKMMEKAFPQNIAQVIPTIDTLAVVAYEKEHVNVNINGYYPGYNLICNNHLSEGRNINDNDIKENRKICVLTKTLAQRLFKKNSAIGKTIQIFNVPFLVVGITKPEMSTDNSKALYAPFTTVRTLYFRDNRVHSVNFVMDGLDTPTKNEEFVKSLREFMAKIKHFSPTDERALIISNDYEFYLQLGGILFSLQFFIWLVGLATLVTGVVGVSNIMTIAVKERIKELGVRKAMGASSFSIIRLVLLESVIVTCIFGYIGIMLGIGLTQLVNSVVVSTLGPNNNYFDNPTVDLAVVLIATCILFICGLIAGYIPAKKAVSVKLVDALAGVV